MYKKPQVRKESMEEIVRECRECKTCLTLREHMEKCRVYKLADVK